MIPANQSLPPLAVISSVSALDQNTPGGTGSQKSGGQQLNKGEQQFAPGQELAARVLSSDGRGRYTLAAGGQHIEVQSGGPLAIGQRLNVLVQKGEKGFFLAFTSPDISQFLTRSLATGGSSQALGMIFGQGLAAQAGGGSSLTAAVTVTGSTARLSVPAVVGELTTLQQQFVEEIATAQAVQLQPSARFNEAVRQVVSELGRQITPLLGEGRITQAMAQVAAALRSLARFFPPQPEEGIPPGLTSSQQQLFQALSSLYQLSAGDDVSGQGEAVLGRIVQQLETQLTPVSISGRELAGQPQNPRNMLAAFANDLQALANLVQLPAVFQGQAASAPVFQRGFDGLFAWHLNFTIIGVPADTAERTAVLLRQLVQGLGLDMERLLAKGDIQAAAKGLKFQLLRQIEEGQARLEHDLQAGDKGKSGEESALLRQVGESHQALQSINFLQVLQVNLDREGMLMLPLPLSFLEQGYLLLEDYQRQKTAENEDGENEAARFSILMKLSALGNVRVDFLQSEEDVYIRFHTASAEINQLFQESQQELQDGLLPLHLQGVSYAAEPAGDPLAALLRKCEGNRNSSLFQARI